MNDYRERLIDFTCRLIRTPSPSGREKEAALLIAAEMKKLGYPEVLIDDKFNVTGVIEGAKPGKNLMLNGHIDHAATGNMENPYSGDIMDGSRFGSEGAVIYGRGACDMKAAVAAMVYAGAVLQKERSKISGNVYVTCVTLEEQARGEGIKHLLDHSGLHFDAAVSGEATDMEVHLGHRGKFEYLIRVHGKTSHASNPARGVNAIFSMNKLLTEIETVYAKSLAGHEFLGLSTVTVIDILSGPGRLTPVVPDYCEIVMDRRYLPGEDSGLVDKEIEEMFDRIKAVYPQFSAEYEQIKDFPVLYCPPEEPVARAAAGAVEEVLHKTPRYKAWKFGVDGAFIAQRGIPCVGFGPGNEHYAHTPEDHVRVDDVYNSAGVYCQIARRFSGSAGKSEDAAL